MREPPFDRASDPSGLLWKRLIRTPFELPSTRRADAVVRLQDLLGQFMIQHKKEHIKALQRPPRIKVQYIDLTPRERDVYNVQAGQLMANLTLTGMVVDHHIETVRHFSAQFPPV